MIERQRRNTEFVGPVRLQQIDSFARVILVQSHESPQRRYLGRLNLGVFRVFFVELVREGFGLNRIAPQPESKSGCVDTSRASKVLSAVSAVLRAAVLFS